MDYPLIVIRGEYTWMIAIGLGNYICTMAEHIENV
jgi:hypothetical protein